MDRYDPQHDYESCWMAKDELGEYVKYSDYAAIEDQLAAARADGYAEGVRGAANALKTEYRISSFWLNGVEVFGAEAATPAACYQTILALIPASPAEPAQVTVQEAAKDESAATCVGCGQPATGMCWTDCGMSLCGAPICDTCRHIDETHGWTHGPRAIAGGGDE